MGKPKIMGKLLGKLMRKSYFIFLRLLASAGIFLFLAHSLSFAEEEAFGATAKDNEGRTVTAIEVKNNKSVSSAMVLSKIQTVVDKPFSQGILNQDLKRLYATDYFTDISIEVEDYNGGIKVIFAVTEKPIVDKVLFEGNKAIRQDKLFPLVKTKKDQMLNYRTLKSDTEGIEALYEKSGFHLAKIDYRVDIDPNTNRAAVVFEITEAERIKIRKIFIEGNYSYSDKAILKLMATRPSALFTSGYYKKEAFGQDLDKIKDFYERQGFMDVVIDKDLRYGRAGKNLFITLKISEGKKYYVGAIKLSGNSVFPEFKLRGCLLMLPSCVFSQEGLKTDIVKLQEYYFHNGYISVKISSDTLLNSVTGNIDIIYNINEGELAYVDQILIKGNVKTKDIVLRRELRIYPGEKFDGEKLKRSKERLYNLGYFEEIGYDVEPGSAENKKDLVVTVKETKTGEFSFGAGYSSIDNLVGFVDLTQKNFDFANWPTFTGDGQQLRLHTEFGTVRQNYELSFTEPWIFDYPYLFGFDLFQRSHSRSTDIGYGYDETRQGGDMRLGKELTEYDRADLIYSLESVQIGDVASEASDELKMEEGTNRINSLGISFTHDTRDNVYNPAKGFLGVASSDYAGGILGGDKNFLRYTFSSSAFFSFFNAHIFELRAKAGAIDDFGASNRVPIYERFFAGGANTIRGYKERRIGPSDPITKDPIGGKSMLLGTAEYTVPLVKVLKGAAFYDIGNVWPSVSNFGASDLKAGAGVGARIKTPLGPVKLDYGYPLNSITGEKKNPRFHFSMSRGF